MRNEVLGRFAETGFYFTKINRNPASLIESFRSKQITCKTWLVEEIANINMNWNKVLVLGSWNSILLYELMNEHCSVNWFDFVDIDPNVHKDRDIYFQINNLENNYSSIVMDAVDFSDHSNYDLIINCSCEHMKDIPAEYGPVYALQSNNYYQVEEHINCVKDEKSLAKKSNLNNLFFHGSIGFSAYTRFMIIGYFV